MPYTDEPKGLAVLNNINMATLGSLVTNLCWLVGSLKFTWVVSEMLRVKDPAAISAMGLMLGAWGYKTTAAVFDANNKRKTHPAYAEVVKAEAEGKVAGAAAAVVISEKAKDLQAARNVMTGEHAAQQPVATVNAEQGSRVEMNVGAPAPVTPPLHDGGEHEQEWATGDKREGLL